VEHRQARFGPNALTPRKGKSPLTRFLLQFNSPLIYVLLVSSVVTAFVKGLVDAGIILGMVLVNAVVGFIQESRAEQAISALAKKDHFGLLGVAERAAWTGGELTVRSRPGDGTELVLRVPMEEPREKSGTSQTG